VRYGYGDMEANILKLVDRKSDVTSIFTIDPVSHFHSRSPITARIRHLQIFHEEIACAFHANFPVKVASS
jgi:hypothetical protein